MKIKEITLTGYENWYTITMKDGTDWELETMDKDNDELPYMVYLGISIVDNTSELREQAKHMLVYADLIDTLHELFPDIEIVAEDDSQELCYWFPLERDQLKILLDKYLKV